MWARTKTCVFLYLIFDDKLGDASSRGSTQIFEKFRPVLSRSPGAGTNMAAPGFMKSRYT